MGDKQPDDNGPSLELPRIFGRRKNEKVQREPAPFVRPQPPEPAVEEDESREFRLPRVPGRLAAIITGLLVGVVGAGLTWASLQACESVKGTESCGGEGFFVLLFILLLMILAGGMLLAAWEVADPKSTSALAVGIICVVSLLLLMEDLFDPWMFVAVPVVSAIAYAVAHWVTTAFVDESDLEPQPPPHDIR
jgi:hypothetical protein